MVVYVECLPADKPWDVNQSIKDPHKATHTRAEEKRCL